jgi:hypothetical protein
VRQDGVPLAITTRIDDPGVAVYFTRDGKGQCIPCDQWHGVLANLRAIGKSVEALRGLERWGAKEMLDAAMAGFAALPAGLEGSSSPSGEWWRQLGVEMEASCAEIDRAFLALVKVQHPDAGGRREVFAVTQQAYEAARREKRCA